MDVAVVLQDRRGHVVQQPFSPPSTNNASCGAGPDGSPTESVESLPGMDEGYQRSAGAASMMEPDRARSNAF